MKVGCGMPLLGCFGWKIWEVGFIDVFIESRRVDGIGDFIGRLLVSRRFLIFLYT